ncbi:MAG: hypothetical protein WAM28_01860 [Chlamydiales bacterium]
MRNFFFFFCLLLASSFSQAKADGPLHLKDKLRVAEPGSYFVTDQNKMYTFLFIHDRSDQVVVIEEVTIPASRYAKKPMNWKEWFEKGAPGHTSWLISQVNLQTAQFEETFSFTHKGWVDMSESNSFLTTLLNLRFRPVPDSQRRRVGGGSPDSSSRLVWNPRLVVDGRPLPRVPFSAWRTRWPSDGSELSRKLITVYLPEDSNNPSLPAYPTCFPYWFEVDGKVSSTKVRVVDSGTNAKSPKTKFPRRSPQLIGKTEFDETGLTFHLQGPPFYREFIVIAEEISSFGHSFPLPCRITPIDQKNLDLVIPREEIEKQAQPGESYRFTIIPKEAPSVCIETTFPLEFNCL